MNGQDDLSRYTRNADQRNNVVPRGVNPPVGSVPGTVPSPPPAMPMQRPPMPGQPAPQANVQAQAQFQQRVNAQPRPVPMQPAGLLRSANPQPAAPQATQPKVATTPSPTPQSSRPAIVRPVQPAKPGTM